MRKKKLYEGKAKIIFASGNNPNFVIQHFKDDITAHNNKKSSIILSKGVINNYISEFFMEKLEGIGIKTHFIKRLNMREQLVKKVRIIPIEVVVRNVVAGSLCKRMGIKEGSPLKTPIVEYFYKDDVLGDPMLSEDHIVCFDVLNPWEIEEIKMIAYRVNDFILGIFAGIGITLVDFKLEFGFYEDELLLADEISPDNCRLWDSKTKKKMDKDRYRLDLDDVLSSYKEVAKRLNILIDILD